MTMKTKLFISIAAICFSFANTEVSAQSFWKQLGKAAEQIGKEIITPVNTDSTSTSQTTNKSAVSDQKTANSKFPNTTISYPSKDIEIKLLSCTASGNDVLIEYTFINKGSTMNNFILMNSSGSDKAYAYDDEGNQYRIASQFGKASGYGSTSAEFPSEIPVKSFIRVYDVKPNATHFTLLKMGSMGYVNKSKTFDGEISFKNLPIER